MQLQPNQAMYLVVYTDEGIKRYRTRVEDSNANQVIVGAPFEKGAVAPIHVGTKIISEVIISEGKDQGRYQAPCVVDRRLLLQNLPMVVLRIAGEWRKIQLRDFVRVNVFVDAKIFPESAAKRKKQKNGEVGLIKDISGGGLLLSSKTLFKHGKRILLSFSLEDKDFFCQGKVVRVREDETANEYGVSFLELDEGVRKEIIQFVYSRQLELYQKSKERES